MKISEIRTGGTGTVEGLILSVEEKETKGNGTYLVLTFSDGEEKITAREWNAKIADTPFAKGDVVFLTLKVEEYGGKPSYVIKEITKSSSSPDAFICAAPIKPEEMYDFLLKNGKKCGVFAPVVTQILQDNKENLLKWAAAKEIHHSIRGGLLYHMFRMTKCAVYIGSVYNKEASMFNGPRDINTELLVAGTILHDIGKLWELDSDEVGAVEYTAKGSLMGHIFMGAELVGRYAREKGLDEENTMLLQHMILAHHGKYEYQAAAIPAIPEAMILHHLDCIDSQIYQFETQASALEPGSMSGFVPSLGARVYRPMSKPVA